MSDYVENLFSDLQKQVDQFSPEDERKDVGTTVEAGDGIARVSGLADVTAQELVHFENGVGGSACKRETEPDSAATGYGYEFRANLVSLFFCVRTL